MDLKELVALNRSGTPRALPSFCTANAYVLDDLLGFAASRNLPVLIEATCNQVNQFGGYTGLTPAAYAANIRHKAHAVGLAANQLILGGDHLGPNPWKHLPAADAMERALALVKAYVEAGFTKIHLDASMPCGGETVPSFEQVAERSAELCAVAEAHAPDPGLLSYVIGTEVPVPGGEADDMAGIAVTTPARLAATIDTHKIAFAGRGVPQGIDRAIAVVVQPGVDFSHDSIFHYHRDKAAGLAKAIGQYDGLAFEAHSTDYQATDNLAALVADHSVILKVGPEITFRFREGIMALDQIEALLDLPDPARAMAAVVRAMQDAPSDWSNYYQGTPEAIRILQLFSYSDRIRYYWDKPTVSEAIRKLIANLTVAGLPAAIATQFGADFPIRVDSVDPRSLVTQRVTTTAERYYRACGWL